MNKNEIIAAVKESSFCVEDLTEILCAVRRARRGVAKTRVSLFEVGGEVTFVSHGKAQVGIVVRLNQSSVIVSYGDETKKVSLISLKKHTGIPIWLSSELYRKDFKVWQIAWGMGVDKAWKQSWQEFLVYCTKGATRIAVIRLLKTVNFRSSLVESTHRQVVEWLDTEPGQRRYKFPLSREQLKYLVFDTDYAIAKNIEKGVKIEASPCS